MKILVTGGAGFIGSNFIRYMVKKHADCEIINLDKLTYAGNLDNLGDIEDNPRYGFYKGDICEKSIVDDLSNDVDAIINFAAETHVDRSIIDAGNFVKTDIYGTYVLLEAARRYDIKRFIQISTDEVYGSIEEGSFNEKDCLNPSSPYSASKAGGDLLVRSYSRTYGLPTIIIRSSNNFGPYQYPEKLIPLFIINAIQNKPLPLYGDGTNVRDWLYVMDNCRAIDLLLHKGKVNEIYNVASGNERKNMQITDLILKKLDKAESLINFVEDRKGHDRRYSLNCEKIRELGWTPKYEFEEALISTVDWYLENEWWWKKLVR
ncbi:MAG: dTDP-glucose 4,6-dehydratase [Candidatus Altiarchaeota archaeon]|nr:dTDP-glucose 4,6-dehydratase [Candidatus Altiarchaeota archaeon]